MNLLLVAATAQELPSFAASSQTIVGQCHIHTLITGVGMVATAFELGRHLSTHQYDLAINAGIAGSLSPHVDLGELLYVEEDRFIELGAEDGKNFLAVDELGLGQSSYRSLTNAIARTFINGLKKVNGISVNTVHGDEQSIATLHSRTNAIVESMEGAAFYYACNAFGQDCIQLRAISNYVERRNRSAWQVERAISGLNGFLLQKLALFKK